MTRVIEIDCFSRYRSGAFWVGPDWADGDITTQNQWALFLRGGLLTFH